MIFKIMIELLICLFALGGIWSAIHFIARRFFGSRHTMLAIEILTQRDAESAEVLIRDALFSVFGVRSGRIVVLTTEEMAENKELQSLWKRYGVSYYCIKSKE